VSPIKRGGTFYLYVARPVGRPLLRTTGTGDKAVYRGMKRMLRELKDARRWSLLDAIITGRRSMGAVYDAYTVNALDALEASLSAAELAPHVESYAAYLRGLGRVPDYVADVQRHVEAFLAFGPTTTADLTSANVTAWIASLTTTPGSRRQSLYAVTGFARYLTDVGVVARYPFDRIKAPKKNDARMRYESEATDKAIVDAASPKYRALFAFIKGTGCDVSTPFRTYRRDVDLERGVALLRGTKSAKRVVHEGLIESWALPYLRDYCSTMTANALLWTPGSGKPGKHGREETPFYSVAGAGKHHDKCCAALHVADYTLKDARHSVAVRMARAGYTPFEIAEQLGNSADLVADVYARFLVKMAHRVTDRVTETPDREAAR
jgi:integrase